MPWYTPIFAPYIAILRTSSLCQAPVRLWQLHPQRGVAEALQEYDLPGAVAGGRGPLSVSRTMIGKSRSKSQRQDTERPVMTSKQASRSLMFVMVCSGWRGTMSFQESWYHLAGVSPCFSTFLAGGHWN